MKLLWFLTSRSQQKTRNRSAFISRLLKLSAPQTDSERVSAIFAEELRYYPGNEELKALAEQHRIGR